MNLMNEYEIYNNILIGFLILAPIVFLSLTYITAPYGRHIRRGWGWMVDNKIGWVIMEAPAPIVFAMCYLNGDHRYTVESMAFFHLILYGIYTF